MAPLGPTCIKVINFLSLSASASILCSGTAESILLPLTLFQVHMLETNPGCQPD